MIVVADTSVLLNLTLVGQVQLLQQLFGSVCIPEAVRREFERLSASAGRFSGLELPEWIQIHEVRDLSTAESMNKLLDPGETEAICLALEMKAFAVLMDESEGRSVARSHGLQTIGILGILLESKRQGHLTAIKPVIESLLNKAKFRLAAALVKQALRDCGEME